MRVARVLAFLAAGLLVIAAGAAGVFWWLLRPAGSPALDTTWAATVSVLAGDGIPGIRDGNATSARFSDPFGLDIAPDGSLVVADAGDAHRIRRLTPDGTITTIAGSSRGYADGPAAMAAFDTPSDVVVAPDGTIYVADTANNAIRRISVTGDVSTLAGGGDAGFADGTGTAARFNGPIGLALTSSGDLIVADTYNDRIRLIDRAGTVRTLAGSGVFGALDGPAAQARFDTPCGIAVDDAGRMFIADTGNNAIRQLMPDGTVTTVGPLSDGGLFRPIAIDVDAAGTLFVAEDGGRIVEIRPGRSARVLAGAGSGFLDGPGLLAKFRAPSGIVVTSPGRVVVSDRRNALLRVVEASLGRPFRAPASPAIRPAFDFDAFALTPLLWPVHPQEGPFEITGTMGELRGSDGQERFHAGLDVRAEQGTVVRAIRDGVVSDPIATDAFNTLNESLRIGPLVYVHQRVGRTRERLFDDRRLAPTYDEHGKLAKVRVKRGSRYLVGEALGTTNAFNHVHLNLGWPREEINPLLARLVRVADHVQPTITSRGIHVLDGDGRELTQRMKGRLIVSGIVRIVVDAWDQVDGNRADRRLGLYRLGYQVLHADGTPAPGFEQMRETIRFDRLVPDERAARLAYAPGSGIPFFGRRRTRFLYEVTNEVRDGRATSGNLDLTRLMSGDYVVRVLATDASGNVAIGNRDLPVTVAAH